MVDGFFSVIFMRTLQKFVVTALLLFFARMAADRLVAGSYVGRKWYKLNAC